MANSVLFPAPLGWVFPRQPPPPLVGSAGQERKGASDMIYITLPPLSVSQEKKAIKG